MGSFTSTESMRQVPSVGSGSAAFVSENVRCLAGIAESPTGPRATRHQARGAVIRLELHR
eukprot:6811704-Prymnesium_polylepis.2